MRVEIEHNADGVVVEDAAELHLNFTGDELAVSAKAAPEFDVETVVEAVSGALGI